MRRLVIVLGVAGGVAVSGAAEAQWLPLGALEGRVVDASTGEPLVGVAISLDGGRDRRSTTTDRDGRFRADDLLPGDYEVVLAPAPGPRVVRRVRVSALGSTALHQAIDRNLEAVEVASDTPASSIDPRSTSARFLIDRRYLTEIPMTGRSVDAVMGAGPTGRGDGFGTAYAGATSLENRFFLNGLDTTDVRTGARGTFLPHELVHQIDAISGGLPVEVGRTMGALVSTVTRSGTNELHGSVFASVTPGLLQAATRLPARAPQTIDVSSELAYTAGVGAELGGPIVRDHAWFHLGVAPQLWRVDSTRRLQSRTDCRRFEHDGSLSACEARFMDGEPDVDPTTGFDIVETVTQQVRSTTHRSYPVVGRVDVALPGHHGAVTAVAVPWHGERPELVGAASAGTRERGLTTNVGAWWVARPSERLWLAAAAGWHRAVSRMGSLFPGLDARAQTGTIGFDFAEIAPYEGPGAAACVDDGPDDRFPLIENCTPAMYYRADGPGELEKSREDRRSARGAAGVTVQALGPHELEAGLDLEDATSEIARVYSGGVLRDGSFERRLVNVAAPDDPDPRFDQRCWDGAFRCQILGGDLDAPDAARDARSLAWGAYVRDRWQPLPALTIHAGARIDAQRLRRPADLQGQPDPYTGYRSTNAVRFVGNVSPRVGVAYDPTGEGRGKLFGQWSRLHEQLPTAIVDRVSSRAGELLERELDGRVLGGPWGTMPVEPGTGAPRTDELLAGAQLELVGTHAGVTWQRRELVRTVEDLGRPDWTFLVIGNPLVGGIGQPSSLRRYDALALTLERRFGRLYVVGSYLYSRLSGNYSGPIRYESGNVDPSRTTGAFDIAERVSNSGGPLPQDRPHYLKLDGAYTVPLGAQSSVVIGSRVRALSGTPRLALEPDWNNLLLPRGALGRATGTWSIDAHLALRRQLRRGVQLELYADVFNLIDRQDPSSIDSAYLGYDAFTNQPPGPIVGGSYEDLLWLKQLRISNNQEVPTSPRRNPRFGSTTGVWSTRFATLGARLTF